MIATDPLSLVFIFCFLLGFGFFIVSALMGGHHGVSHSAGHIHTPAIHHAPVHAIGPQATGNAHTSQTGTPHTSFSFLGIVNPMSVALFLLGFGLFGYFFHNLTNLIISFTIVLATGGGLLLAALLLLALNRLFLGSEGSTEQDVADRTGMLGKVSISIPAQGIGEIIYTSPGGLHKSIPARSFNLQPLKRDQEVVVVNYQNGVAEVDTWEHFMQEETDMTAEAEQLEPIKPAQWTSSSNKADILETELINRKDMQKE